MEIAKPIVELIGHVAWPAAIFGLGWLFRPDIKTIISAAAGLAGRVRKVGPAEFQEATKDSVGSSSDTNDGGEALTREHLPDDPTLKPWIDHVKNVIAANNLRDAQDLQERLINALAWNSRHNDFLAIGRSIFGTQLAALKELEASGPLTTTALQTLHVEHEDRAVIEGAETALDFLSWIGFMRNHKLTTMDETGQYRITDIGHLFVQFANENGIDEKRLF